MTKGEYRVGVDLASNPTDNTIFTLIKKQAAGLIDLIDTIQTTDGEVIRLKSLAQTEIESAAMWACKAASKMANPGAIQDLVPSGPAAQVDPFVTEVAEAVAAIMGSLGPWAQPMPPMRLMGVMRRLELRGFTNTTEADVEETLAEIWKSHRT